MKSDKGGKESVIDIILRSQAEFKARTATAAQMEMLERQKEKDKMRAEIAARKSLLESPPDLAAPEADKKE